MNITTPGPGDVKGKTQLAVNSAQRKGRSTMQKTMMTAIILATLAMALFVGRTLASLHISYFAASENFMMTFPVSGELLLALYIILMVSGSGIYAYGKLKYLVSHFPSEKKMTAPTTDMPPDEDSFQEDIGTEQALNPAT